MNHDESHFEKNVKKFSVVQQCPKCRELSLMFKDGLLSCTRCGYTEHVPTVR